MTSAFRSYKYKLKIFLFISINTYIPYSLALNNIYRTLKKLEKVSESIGLMFVNYLILIQNLTLKEQPSTLMLNAF